MIKMWNGQTPILEIESDKTIGYLKEKIEETCGVLSKEQRLICNGKELADIDKTFSEYNLGQHSIVLVAKKKPVSHFDQNESSEKSEVLEESKEDSSDYESSDSCADIKSLGLDSECLNSD